MTTDPHDERNRAFNLGADARIAGRNHDWNPYPSQDKLERRAWYSGWFDAHTCWSAWVKPWHQHPVRELPPLRGRAVA
jgi:ribosome modulation factor